MLKHALVRKIGQNPFSSQMRPLLSSSRPCSGKICTSIPISQHAVAAVKPAGLHPSSNRSTHVRRPSGGAKSRTFGSRGQVVPVHHVDQSPCARRLKQCRFGLDNLVDIVRLVGIGAVAAIVSLLGWHESARASEPANDAPQQSIVQETRPAVASAGGSSTLRGGTSESLTSVSDRLTYRFRQVGLLSRNMPLLELG